MNTHALAKKNPSLLIKVLRVIENEEFANASISQRFNKVKLIHNLSRRKWRARSNKPLICLEESLSHFRNKNSMV